MPKNAPLKPSQEGKPRHCDRRRRREARRQHRATEKTGTIYFIDRRPEDIAGDVEVSTRPLLAEGSAKVYTLYHERIALYRKAADEIVVNEGALESVLEN